MISTEIQHKNSANIQWRQKCREHQKNKIKKKKNMAQQQQWLTQRHNDDSQRNDMMRCEKVNKCKTKIFHPWHSRDITRAENSRNSYTHFHTRSPIYPDAASDSASASAFTYVILLVLDVLLLLIVYQKACHTIIIIIIARTICVPASQVLHDYDGK